MAIETSLTLGGSIGGVSSGSARFAASSTMVAAVSGNIAAAKAGTLTTRTDNDTGTLTVTAHGIADASKISIFWDGGARYNVTVGTTTADTIPFDLGSGDNLPADESAIWVCLETTFNIDVVGDNLDGIFAKFKNGRGHLQFYDVGDSVLYHVPIPSAQEFLLWNGVGFTNPLAGDTVAYVKAAGVYTTAGGDEFTLSMPYS